jgi:hypothetical protein
MKTRELRERDRKAPHFPLFGCASHPEQWVAVGVGSRDGRKECLHYNAGTPPCLAKHAKGPRSERSRELSVLGYLLMGRSPSWERVGQALPLAGLTRALARQCAARKKTIAATTTLKMQRKASIRRWSGVA